VQICEDFKKKVEEEWAEPIRRRRAGIKRECEKKRCRKICLCCNKWFCWISIFWYWVVEWVFIFIVKWVVYTVCRVVSSLITLLLLVAWIAWRIFCAIDTQDATLEQQSNLNLRETTTLQVEVVIVDKSEVTKNPITEAEIDARIRDADRILQERARIEVTRRGEIRRTISERLYSIDASSFASGVGEWFRDVPLLIGRDNPRYLTVYAVGEFIGPVDGVHQPVFGSVFIRPGTADTTLAHELGHALLALNKMGHSEDKRNLMFATGELEAAVSWPRNTPTLEVEQWCSMRQSRWLNWVWRCETCPSPPKDNAEPLPGQKVPDPKVQFRREELVSSRTVSLTWESAAGCSIAGFVTAAR